MLHVTIPIDKIVTFAIFLLHIFKLVQRVQYMRFYLSLVLFECRVPFCCIRHRIYHFFIIVGIYGGDNGIVFVCFDDFNVK